MELTDLFAGEWLLVEGATEPYNQYRKAYAGLFVSRWSGGVTWRTTRAVLEQIIEDQADIGVAMEDRETFFWVNGALVAYDYKANDIEVTNPDDDGLYNAPGWTWCQLDAEDTVGEVVGRPRGVDTVGDIAAVRVIQECCAEAQRSLEQGEERTERDIAADIIRRLQTAYQLEDE